VRRVLGRALVPVLALLTAFGMGAVVIVLTDVDHLKLIGTDPIGAIGGAAAGVLDGYRAMLAGAIGDPGRISEALRSGSSADIARAIRPLTEALLGATPFIFVALGLTVSFRAGMLNLGADGQFLVGGLGTITTVGLISGHLPPALVLVLGLTGGTLAGAAYGFIPGFLKARTGAHEVITTLMLNMVAPAIPLAIAPAIALIAASIGTSAGPPGQIPSVPRLIELPTIRLDGSFVVALAMAAIVSFLLFRTTIGFELRATGLSRGVARSAGMRPGASMTLAMAVSGGLAGMASAFIALGPGAGIGAGPLNLGYVALALALLGGLRPSGVVLVSLLYGALSNGAKTMVIATGIPLPLLVVVIAVAMTLVATPGLVRSIWRLLPETAAEVVAPSVDPTGSPP
jgi:general nucleoside transport system permease protein